MKKQKERWNNLLPCEKKFEVASLILVIVFAIIFILDIFLPYDLYILEGVFLTSALACYSVSVWRSARVSAIVFIVAAAWNAIRTIYEIAQLFR